MKSRAETHLIGETPTEVIIRVVEDIYAIPPERQAAVILYKTGIREANFSDHEGLQTVNGAHLNNVRNALRDIETGFYKP
jgi:hypothetical protein